MRFLSNISLMAIISLLIIACGSGGGGGGGGENGEAPETRNEAEISYSGITTQAAITENNAEDISMMAFEGGAMAFGDMSISQKSSAGSQTETTKNIKPARPRTLILSQTLEKSLRDTVIISKYNNAAVNAMEHNSDIVNGNCGGSMERTMNYDPATGDISGTINYRSYCSDGALMSGKTDFSGKYNTLTGQYLLLTINFYNLSAYYEGDTSISRGSISFDYTTAPYAVTINMLISCSCSEKVYNYENFRMTFSEGWDSSGSYVEFTMSGRFYDPAYGYIEVSTERSFRIYDGKSWPSTGILTIHGYGNSSAQFEIFSEAGYYIRADEDGDGIFERAFGDHWSGSENNLIPIADAGADKYVYVGDLVTLSGNSSDGDKDLLKYRWSFVSVPSGSTASLSNADTLNPSFTADIYGIYVISLVADDYFSSSVPDTVVIKVLTTLNGKSIQDALDAASSGDTILVPPGMYLGGIDFGWKATTVTLKSIEGPERTILDGDKNRFKIGYYGVVEGFTITNFGNEINSAILTHGIGAQIIGNIFEGNVVESGSIIWGGFSPVIERNIFRYNTCDSQHLYGVITDIGDSPRIVNNVFHDNLCSAIVINLDWTKPEVINNTIISNNVGIYVGRVSSQHVYRNNIIVNNSIGLEKGSYSGSDLPVWESNLVFGNTINYVNIIDQTGTNSNISIDPQFIDASSGNYRLKSNSPAVDAGSELSSPITDFDGISRPVDGDKDGIAKTDIGAFEFK